MRLTAIQFKFCCFDFCYKLSFQGYLFSEKKKSNDAVGSEFRSNYLGVARNMLWLVPDETLLYKSYVGESDVM